MLKRLIKISSTDLCTKEIRYISIGAEGKVVWGARTVNKDAKLSTLISLINSDLTSALRF